RSAVANAEPEAKGHYTVYLPAYDDQKLVALFMKLPSLRWHIFSKHARQPYHVGKISVFPVNADTFTESLVSSTGVVCGAGFETPAEALYLRKKLLIVPMKGQYEQKCNAVALRKLGVSVIKKMKKKNLSKVEKWLDSKRLVDVDYKPVARKAVERLMKKYGSDD
ncbi:MAG: glycosyl transferase, partial [Cyclobacteriaceae bacterium]|nr:glycosyl transferase [Cyclobacteriaceae bacterium]